MKSNPYVQFLIRFYGRLLWLYPSRFRDKFGPEMLKVFHQATEEASKTGIFSLVRLILLLLPFLVGILHWLIGINRSGSSEAGA